MHQPTRDQVDWQQPFLPEEYVVRRERVRIALQAAGLDGILVSSPPDLNYLFGYDHIWFAKDNLCVCYLPSEYDAHVFFDNDGHEVLVSIYPEITDVVYFKRGPITEHIAVVANEVSQRGWAKGRLAIQPGCYGPHPFHVQAVGESWKTAGAEIVDGSDLIEDVRLIKTPAEVAVVREAAKIANNALALARDAIRPGMRETELEGILVGDMMRLGGGYPAIRCMIGGGPRAGVHHQPPSHRQFREGDLIHIDFCSSLHRYHVNQCRTFALGDVDPRWHDLFARNEAMMDVICDEVKPGDSMARLHDVGHAYGAKHDLLQYEWLIGGYTLGISMPPDWVGRHRPKPREDIPPPVLEPGLLMNFENQYDTYKEQWRGGTGGGLIDTLLVTEDAIEILTTLPRGLVTVG